MNVTLIQTETAATAKVTEAQLPFRAVVHLISFFEAQIKQMGKAAD